ncbi:MAG: SIS domain-containing protein, partial [Firmicutes bacterium]|nr:SIS domain-containing protein [Bacillota bacterium]
MLQQKGADIYNRIHEQPALWQETLDYINSQKDELVSWFKQEAFDRIILTGCGSSYHVAAGAEKLLSTVGKLPAYAYPASEILIDSSTVMEPKKKELLIAISRSGETSETVWVAEKLQKKNPSIKTIALTCQKDSSIAKLASKTLLFEKAMEDNPIMIKSFSAPLFAFQPLAAAISGDQKYNEEIKKVPSLCEMKKFHSQIQQAAAMKFNHAIFLGSGVNYPIAMEGMLKLKEMAGISAEAYHSLEFRHGAICAVSPQTLIILLLSENLKSAEEELMREISSMKGQLIVFCEQTENRLQAAAEFVFELHSGLSESARQILLVPYLQLFAFYHSLSRGLNPDK